MTREEAREYLINLSWKMGTMDVEYLTEKDGEKIRSAVQTLQQNETVTEFADRCRECGARYGKLLKQKLCGDAISRQAAVEKIHWLGLDNDTAILCGLAIRALPSVQPIRPDCENCEKVTKAYFDGQYYADSLEAEQCEDAISREAAIDAICSECGMVSDFHKCDWYSRNSQYQSCGEINSLRRLPSATPQPKTGHCKDCKYFEYDSVARIDGIPLIVAHEICSKWGDGCKTREDGYCFMFEQRMESENKG